MLATENKKEESDVIVSCSGGSLGLAGSQIPTTFFTRQGDESHSGIHREVIGYGGTVTYSYLIWSPQSLEVGCERDYRKVLQMNTLRPWEVRQPLQGYQPASGGAGTRIPEA